MDKVKGFGEADAFPSDEAKTRWIWPEFHPALRVSGWRTPTLSGGIIRWKNIGLATLRVDCLAIRETELIQYDRKLL
ncbi:hypothetical protein FHS21_000457 [Phyllobacterium trifolii]|uniref:Uncharacterized protein n=1 Tax=Phyllobacterium trifolii TaxID=300193 RepID=A0A839U1V6_9HYPH|nr:hypothetical protein [Phyllobacterium trifolii]MBB3144074.1 hypothetical protein [Phyllobacterium trifolii]